MKAELEKLIATLREELTQYGELLALLEQQQDLIVSRSAEGLLENLGAINAQVPVVAAARQHRDQAPRIRTAGRIFAAGRGVEAAAAPGQDRG